MSSSQDQAEVGRHSYQDLPLHHLVGHMTLGQVLAWVRDPVGPVPTELMGEVQ